MMRWSSYLLPITMSQTQLQKHNEWDKKMKKEKKQ
jgi:hypothetical protein